MSLRFWLDRMKFPSIFKRKKEPKLADLVEGERHSLEQILGSGFSIDSGTRGSCRIIGENFEIEFIDDRRDPWVYPSLRPLRSLQLFDSTYGADEWFQFMGLADRYFIELPEHRARGYRDLDCNQVREAIAMILPIVELWKDPEATRDAYWFMRGHNVAYNEWCQSRKIEDKAVKTQRDAMWFERGKAYQRNTDRP